MDDQREYIQTTAFQRRMKEQTQKTIKTSQKMRY